MKNLYTTCGTQFQVDDKYEILLAGFTWKLSGNDYVTGSTGKYRNRYLHRVIAELEGLDLSNQIDHKDLNRLNNQSYNLRSATPAQNLQNRRIYSNNRTGYKGVGFNKAMQKYKARINGKHLGYFNTAEEASKVREKAAKIYHKEFAR